MLPRGFRGVSRVNRGVQALFPEPVYSMSPYAVQKRLLQQFTFPVSQRAASGDWSPWQRPDVTQSSAAAASTAVTLSRGPHTDMVAAGGQARTSPSGPTAPGTYQNRHRCR